LQPGGAGTIKCSECLPDRVLEVMPPHSIHRGHFDGHETQKPQ
jgi:hypothetical protein